MSPTRWIETFNARGIVCKLGRNGATYAHRDIAFEFTSWISPEFKLYLISEFERLKAEDIPLNKKGSGVRRMVLFNFLRARLEQLEEVSDNPTRQYPRRPIIYAIEEPETAQHFDNQRLMVETLAKLSAKHNVQVLITTHSGVIVSGVGERGVNVVSKKGNRATFKAAEDRILPPIYGPARNLPSMNEINYLTFGECGELYHDELFGYIDSEYCGGCGTCGVFKGQLPSKKTWIRDDGKEPKEESYTLSYYIRNSLHHPENRKNKPYTTEELRQSIKEMRMFITRSRKSKKPNKNNA